MKKTLLISIFVITLISTFGRGWLNRPETLAFAKSIAQNQWVASALNYVGLEAPFAEEDTGYITAVNYNLPSREWVEGRPLRDCMKDNGNMIDNDTLKCRDGYFAEVYETGI
jgi:hypothetical protein